MITTIVDKNYLYKEARYLLASIYKYMPHEKVYLFIVNCASEDIKKDVLSWNPNTIIDFREFKVPQEQYKSYMYVMMTFVFDWLLNEIKVNEDIIYLDADIVLKNDISELYKLKYDLMFRYQPFNRIKGPTTNEFGGIMNNGCIVMKNNEVMKEYSKRLRKNILDYLKTKKNPIIYVKEAKVITCIDQEMLFTTYLEMQDKINFFPLNDIYNDTHFTKEGKVWHAKGVCRNYPEYLIECWKYGRKDVKIIREYGRLYYRKLKKNIKSFFIEPPEYFYIRELGDIVNTLKIKTITIINSHFYIENKNILMNFNIICYDTDPKIYYKNKNKLKKLNVYHKYIIYDTQIINKQFTDLLICEQKNFSIANLVDSNYKLIKKI
ncbi:glycosyltransferase family protein [Nautilia lithotrophica]